MKYNELNLKSHKAPRRSGRGISAGRGKTAGRGTKGQRARAGSGKRPGFEGGQNPLLQRIPKIPGFRSHRVKAENVYLDQLESVGSKTIDNNSLAKAKLTSSPYVRVKLLSRGDVSAPYTITLQGASESAVAAVQKAGGTFHKVPMQRREKTSDKAKKDA